MRVQTWSILVCVWLAAGMLTGAGTVRAAGTALPTVAAIQGGSAQGALTTTWALGSANGATAPKPTTARPLMALLTWSYLPYGSSMPQYTVSTVLFGNGTSTILTSMRALYEVARATPSLYLVLGLTGNGRQAGRLGVLAIDTYHYTANTVLHGTAATYNTAASCGVVFAAAGKSYTVRGTAQPGPGGADFSHALLAGAAACS